MMSLIIPIILAALTVFMLDPKKLDSWYVIFILSIIYGFLQFPYSIHSDVESEIVRYYVLPLNKMDISIDSLASDVMPLYYYAVFYLKKIFSLETENAIILSRYFIALFSLIALRKLVLAIAEEKGEYTQINSVKVIGYALFFYVLDHTVSWLMWVDQFRNATGNVFYLFFVYSLFKKKNWGIIIFSILSIFSHKQYIVLIPFTIFLYFISNYKISTKNSFYVILPLLVVCLMVFVSNLVVPVINEYNWFSLRGKFSHSSVNLGIYEAFLSKPGVVLATAFYLSILLILFSLLGHIKNSHILRFSFMYFLIFFVISKVNILGIGFVEPARVYYTFSPFLCVLLAWSMCYVSSHFRVLVLVSYVTYNFLLLNFSKESIQSTLIMASTSWFDIVEHLYGGNLIFFIKVLLIIIFVFMAIILVKMLREINISSSMNSEYLNGLKKKTGMS